MKEQVNLQQHIELFWNAKPCDSDRSSHSPGTREYFLDIERDRYGVQAHIMQVLGWLEWYRKTVLEIGTGVGTDARHIISRGGVYTGINIDQGSTDLTARALATFQLPGTVKKASAKALPFSDATFDIVYSFGVLHHIPNLEVAISEVYRVLKPGGSFLFMVYNRSSINYCLEIMFLRKLFRRFLVLPGSVALLGVLGFSREKLHRHRELYRASRRMSPEEWLSRNTDGPDNPYSTVYGLAEVEELLRQFRIERHDVCFFDYRHWGVIGRLLPRFLIDALGNHWGWHRIVCATKPIRTA